MDKNVLFSEILTSAGFDGGPVVDKDNLKKLNDLNNEIHTHSTQINLEQFHHSLTADKARVIEKLDGNTRVYRKFESKENDVTDSAIFVGSSVEVENPYDGSKRIHFNTNESQLDATDKAALDPIIDFLVENPTTNVTIEGHTDTQGSHEYNEKLSQQRADATLQYMRQALEGRGIENPEERIPIEYFGSGERNLVEKTSDNIASEANRSVDINFHYESDKIEKIRNFEKLYQFNGSNQKTISISPRPSDTLRYKLKDGDLDKIVIDGRASLLLAGDTRNTDIHLANITEQNIRNIRISTEESQQFSQVVFRDNPENHTILLEGIDHTDTSHVLATIHVPEGYKAQDLELATYNDKGKFRSVSVNQEVMIEQKQQQQGNEMFDKLIGERPVVNVLESSHHIGEATAPIKDHPSEQTPSVLPPGRR